MPMEIGTALEAGQFAEQRQKQTGLLHCDKTLQLNGKALMQKYGT